MESGEKADFSEILAREPAWMQKPFAERFIRDLPFIFLFVFLFLLYGYFLAHKIDLTTADLGRHIKNGEILLVGAADTRRFEDADKRGFILPSILTSNFYSYTHPQFPVTNHHWGSGVLFYVIWRFFGFLGVHLFFIALSLATLFVFLLSAKERAGWGNAGVAALLAIPLLAERTEIRPEAFSYLFSGLFFLILSHRNIVFAYDRKQILYSEKRLWLLPVLQIVWVNMHIYFLLGPLIIGAFLLEDLIRYARRNSATSPRTIEDRGTFTKKRLKTLGLLFFLTAGATFISPFGYRAITEAATLFQNFGYRLAENQSVWFLERLGMSNPNFLVFKIALAALVLSYVWILIKKRPSFSSARFFVMLGMTILALFAVRNFALFGFFLIPVLAGNISGFLPENIPQRRLASIAAGLACAAFILAVSFGVPRFFPYWRGFGFGIEDGNSASADFIREQEISGPIFNNYDIGGYLIFYLFPSGPEEILQSKISTGKRVFVDNRPEAYPSAFFQETYIPMQETDEAWSRELRRYDFNAIVFSYRDITPWAQKFLVTRIKDTGWAPVFADSKVLVFLRRAEENKAVISRFELPKEMFRVSDH